MQGKEYVIRDMVVLDSDLQTTKKYNGENYTIKYPLPQERKDIARRIAAEFNGVAMEAFTYTDRNMIIRDAEIDVVVEGPDHWKGSDECLDEDLKNWLYKQSQEWQQAFQEKLKKNKFAKRSKKGQVPD